jgi:hypothetical protein
VSNFFSNLALRAQAVPLAASDAVKPRLPSLFELSDTAASSDIPAKFTLEVDAPTPQSEPPLVMPARAEGPIATAVAVAASPPLPAPTLPAPAPRSLPPADMVVPQIAAPAALPVVTAAPPAPALSSSPASSPPIAEPRRLIVRDDTAPAEVVPRRASAIMPEAAPPTPIRRSREPTDAEPQRVVAPRTMPRAEAPVGPRVVPRPQPPMIPQPHRPPAMPSLLSPRQPPTPPAQPEIHISIGRIEVRAVTAPSESRRPAATSPVMTLEAYLRSRAGERRG